MFQVRGRRGEDPDEFRRVAGLPGAARRRAGALLLRAAHQYRHQPPAAAHDPRERAPPYRVAALIQSARYSVRRSKVKSVT